ncbi:hypothetical protein BH11PLA1_BH11PLA1_00380 [soil metagenome]
MRTYFSLRSVCAAVCVAVGMAAPAARAQTFVNTTPIAIPDSGSAAPYPSVISIAGVAGPIQTIRVRLSGLSHTFQADLDILLVSPSGQKVMLLSDVAGSPSDVTFDFAPDALQTVPGNAGSGVYLPTDVNLGDTFPAPAPAGPYSTNMGALLGGIANGNWSLYVVDDAGGDLGTIAGGWSIVINGGATPTLRQPTQFVYQGRLTNSAGAPITTPVQVRFGLWNHPTAAFLGNRLAQTGLTTLTPGPGGVITQPVDFGPVLTTADSALFVEVEVANPVGAAAVTLTPRQPIAYAPRADVAERAVSFGSGVATGNSVNFAANIDVSPAAGGTVIIGPIAGQNVAIDGNEIMARESGETSTLFLNAEGGPVVVGTQSLILGAALAINGSQVILPGTAAAPNVLAFGPYSAALGGGAQNTDAIGFYRNDPAANVSELRLNLGDDPGGSAASRDSFVIGSQTASFIESFRFNTDGVALKPGGGAWAVLSDPRAKHDVTPLRGTLDRLMQLRGYSYEYNPDRVASGVALKGTQIGLMADEVARVFPDWVSTDPSGTRFVTERSTTALMVEALRDLRAEKDAQVEAVRRENADLKARLERLEKAITKPER